MKKKSTTQSATFCLRTVAGPTVSVGIGLALLAASAFSTASGQANSSKHDQKSQQMEKTRKASRALTFDKHDAPALDIVPLHITPHAVLLIEDFDGVTPPALPEGWIAMNATGPDPLWTTSDSGDPKPPADSAPNAAFVDDPDEISDKTLDSPSVAIHAAAAQLSFRNNYDLEETYDGGVLEISIDGGAFNDVIAAGGSFVTGGYTQSINKFFKNPLAGRQAWSGNSGGFITTTVNLPPGAMGHNVVLRWRMGSDASVFMDGWRIDNVELSEPSGPQIAAAGSTLLAEGCSPPNGALDPGETVTVDFCVQNKGAQNTANLVGTLEASGGVTNPSGPETFGQVNVGGPAVCRSFTFTATGTCGGPLTATIRFQDGATDLGLVTYTFTMGVQGTAFIENFDGVSVPTLPSGWVASNAGGPTPLWATSDSGEPKPPADSSPNAAFVDDADMISDKRLDSPPISISTAFARLTFRSNFTFEEGFDGGVLEISVGGGAFMDIIDAGGNFVSGGYNQVISTCCDNPLANRPAWTGDSGGFLTTTVRLPATAAGQNVVLRWRAGSDFSVSNPGWRIDDISISEPVCSTNCQPGASSISGDITYCTGNSRPVPGVTLTLSGDATASATTNISGNYEFTSLTPGDNYAVTPTKDSLQPSVNLAGIDTLDAALIQRHYLRLGTPLTGCALSASRTNPSNTGPGPDTTDASAIQRFYLVLPNGNGDTGQWRFTPPERFYPSVTGNQVNQDYETYVLGDVNGDLILSSSNTFSLRHGSADVPLAAIKVVLPNVNGAASRFTAVVSASNIDAGEKLIAFQGDFSFDSSVVSFQSPPVARAGLTARGNWALAANVLGTGKIKTLRVSCFALDANSVLAGEGALFELRLSRVSAKPGASTALVWSAEPNNFIFIDENAKRRVPASAPAGKISWDRQTARR